MPAVRVRLPRRVGPSLRALGGGQPLLSILPAADLLHDIARYRAIARRPVTRSSELVANLRLIYQSIFAIDFDRYDPAAVARSAPQIISELFDLRVELREHIADWQARGLMRQDAQTALRDCFRIVRYASDIVGEVMNGFDRLGSGEEPHRAFSGPGMSTLVNRRFDTGAPLPFRSGDVLLVRGVRHNSAAIARLGDVDSQFSHAAIVYVDGEGNPFLVEALIEDGSVVTPLADALAHGVARAILFRPRDAAVARRAADLIHDRVSRSVALGKPIPYDFSMQLKSYKRLFCSKLVRQAFDHGSAGRMLLPTFPTRFNANRDFYRRIGVKTPLSFAPGDLEIEPHLDLVAEWQDFRGTARVRMQDLLMTKLFEWMELRDWRFREDWPVFLVSVFGRVAAGMSERAKTLVSGVVPKIPPHMRRRTIATIAMLHQTAEPLLAKLEAMEAERVQRTGRPLHPREAFALLEKERRNSGGRIGYLVGPKGGG